MARFSPFTSNTRTTSIVRSRGWMLDRVGKRAREAVTGGTMLGWFDAPR
ncbi:MAG: hypothetical protein MI923_23035 [Phycisphaerales bacterium]|nr:hypothetical protein [Phycisphaerales bacterium]